MKFFSVLFFLLAAAPQLMTGFNVKRTGVFLYEHVSYADILKYAKSDQKLDLNPSEVARVERCFYTREWQLDRKDECYWMTDLSGLRKVQQGTRDIQFRVAYARLIDQTKADEELVKECYFNHRHDDFADCRGISWGTCPDANGAKETERSKLRTFYWNELAKKDPEYYSVSCFQ